VSGNHSVYVKDANGAKALVIVAVANTPGPSLLLIATAANCTNNDGSVSAANSGGTAPFMYSEDGISYQTNRSFSSLDTGNKMFYIKDANGCIDSQTITVPLDNNLAASTGNNSTICEGSQVKLNATSNAQSFAWSPVSGLDNINILNPLASPGVTTKYYLTAVLGLCTKEDSIMVFVNPAPVPNAGSDTTVCYGKSIQLSGSGGSQFQWSPATFLDNSQIAGPVINRPTKTITYQLSVVDANGCPSLQGAAVTINVTPPAKVFAGNDTSILINQTLQLNAIDVNNSGFTNYIWSPATGLNNPTIEAPVALITKNIVYTIVASTSEGCEGTDSISIKAFTLADIFVPTAFTPNNDGHNDVLRVILIGIKELKGFAVFNRWGQQLFFSRDPGQGWDGTAKGTMQNTGTYVWMAWGIDFEGRSVQKKGTVILIR
ncbi:MAG TPA: gliding motility-associated C-terminal domain-containing protein, partial [Puia sp.]|nr:gliding motility-associated C-terminal domain-containing protein [Puia sp.]